MTKPPLLGLPSVKASVCQVGDPSSIPGLGRFPGKGNGKPLQYSCLGNPMDRGARWAAAHGVTKSWTWLSDWTAAAAINQQMGLRFLQMYFSLFSVTVKNWTVFITCVHPILPLEKGFFFFLVHSYFSPVLTLGCYTGLAVMQKYILNIYILYIYIYRICILDP